MSDNKDLGGDERPQRSQEPSPVGAESASHAVRLEQMTMGDLQRRYYLNAANAMRLKEDLHILVSRLRDEGALGAWQQLADFLGSDPRGRYTKVGNATVSSNAKHDGEQ